VVDFNSGTFASAGFQQNLNGGAVIRYATAAGVGLNSTAGVTTGSQTTADSTAVYTPEVADLTGGAFTTSMYFKFQPVTNTAGPTLLQMGLVRDTSGKLLGYTDATLEDAFVSGRILSPAMNVADTSVAGFQFQTQSKLEGVMSATTTTLGTPDDTFALTTGNWYQLVVGLARSTTVGDFTVTTTLNNSSADGTVGTVVKSLSGTVTNADVYGDQTLYAAFRAFHNRGTNTLDNFAATTVVPEPMAVSSVALAGAGLGLRRRSRR
jgi:hypothetical protein